MMAAAIPLRALRQPSTPQGRIIWLRGLAFQLDARMYKYRDPRKRVTVRWFTSVTDGYERENLCVPTRKEALRQASLIVRLQHMPQWSQCVYCFGTDLAPRQDWRSQVELACRTCHRRHYWEAVGPLTVETGQGVWKRRITRYPDGRMETQEARRRQETGEWEFF